ncbi:unnamed protein product [Blepharisma stoltei]|uniref:Uncharacterized protein n=1 Tax=Blepharisma stoltei TaxID=1481888 RepID=A0AAU9J591_9CILI|nr:unnamed protein product [Blepharisma stoltei]
MLSSDISPELKCSLSLLSILEEMLFSMPLKIQLVQKYERMREIAFSKLNLQSDTTHIWKLQQQAHSNAESKNKEKTEEKNNENIFIERLKQSHIITKNYAALVTRLVLLLEAHYSNISDLLENSKEKRPNLMISENEIQGFPRFQVNAEIISKCSEIEFSESTYLEKIQKLFDAEEDNLKDVNEQISRIIQENKTASKRCHEQILNEISQKEMVYKELDLTKKRMQDIDTEYKIKIEELKLAWERSEIETKNSYFSEINELKTKLSIQNEENSKLTQELGEIKNRISLETSEIHKLYENKLEDLNNSILHQTSFHKQKIQELELSFHGRESQLLNQLDKLQTEDSSVLRNLRENIERLQVKVQELRDVLKAVCDRTSPIFDKFAGKEDIAEDFARRKEEISDFAENDSWEHYSELLTELEFIGYAFSKLSTDNDWLIDRLDECSKENEDLRQIPHHLPETRSSTFEEVLSSLSANKLILRDFQEARSKLMNHFTDSKIHNLSGIS